MTVIKNYFSATKAPLEKLRKYVLRNLTSMSEYLEFYHETFGNPDDKLGDLIGSYGYLSTMVEFIQEFISAAVKDYPCMTTKEGIEADAEYWFIRSPSQTRWKTVLHKFYTHGIAKHWVELQEQEEKQMWRIMSLNERPTIQMSQVLTIMKGCCIILIFAGTILLIEIANL